MPETRPPARTTRLFLAMVVLAALALHARAIGFGFSYLDDDVLILEQQATLTEPSAVWRSVRASLLSDLAVVGRGITPTTARW